MDDGFIALLDSININLFLQCLNSMHPNIKYTSEKSTTTTIRGLMAHWIFWTLTSSSLKITELKQIYFIRQRTCMTILITIAAILNIQKITYHSVWQKGFCVCSLTIQWRKNDSMNYAIFYKTTIIHIMLSKKEILMLNFRDPPRRSPQIIYRWLQFTMLTWITITSFQKQNFLLNNTQDYELKEVFVNCKVILSQRQPKSVLKHLSTSKFTEKRHQEKEQPLISKCNDRRCKICTMYLQTDESFLLSNGKRWIVKCKMTCHSKNVLYFLQCNRCNGLQTYIGKTK